MTYPEHSHTGSVTLSERLARISLFRWRLEWAFLVMIAVSIVLGEQAREQRAADPYLIIQGGRSATATVRAGRVAAHTVSPRWMRTRQEMRTLLDLEWRDRDGNLRTVENYLLDWETIMALRIDPSTGSWPTQVQVLYSDPLAIDSTTTAAPPAVYFQPGCGPWQHCRVLVLAPDAKTQAELDAELADVLEHWAPRGLWLGLGAFFCLLGLRLAGIIDSRPSLE